MTVAALPMYDWPEVRTETDAAWADLRARLREAGLDAPDRLARCNADLPAVPGGIRDASGGVIAPDPATLDPDGFDLGVLWRHPDLMFAQTCWGPMEAGLAEHVTVLGQPDYSRFPGGEGELYSSAVLMRRDSRSGFGSALPPSGLPAISPTRGEITPSDRQRQSQALQNGQLTAERLISPSVGEMAGRPEGGVPQIQLPINAMRNTRFAFNSPDSMSGILALTRDLDSLGGSLDIFSERIETGAHRASVVAVAEGRADTCAVDCRTWNLAERFEPATAALDIVGWTAMRKGLPYVAARRFAGDVGLTRAVAGFIREQA